MPRFFQAVLFLVCCVVVLVMANACAEVVR